MFSEAKVSEIYCVADDFCKEFARHQENYMLKDTKKNVKHRNKPNRMSDAEIILIMILFHSGGYRCFKQFYQEYVCKHLGHLFPKRVSYNRFVELEKEVLFPLTIFIKTVLLGTCTGIALWILLPCVFAETSESISTRLLRDWRLVGSVLWDGSSDSNYI